MDGQLQKEEKDALLEYRLKNLIGEEEHWQVCDPPSSYSIIYTLEPTMMEILSDVPHSLSLSYVAHLYGLSTVCILNHTYPLSYILSIICTL